MCFALVGEIRAIVVHEALLDLRTLGGTIRRMDERFAEGASERQGGVSIRLRADRKILHGAGR